MTVGEIYPYDKDREVYRTEEERLIERLSLIAHRRPSAAPASPEPAISHLR